MYEEYKDHVYMEAMNAGTSVYMRGTVACGVLFVEDCDSRWNDAELAHGKKIVQAALKELHDQAAQYKTRLKFVPRFEKIGVKSAVSRINEQSSYIEEIQSALQVPRLSEYIEKLKRSARCQNAALIICANKNDRSYAHQSVSTGIYSYSEYVVAFVDLRDEEDSKRMLCHEMAHLFGASDYYFPILVQEAAKKHFGDTLMVHGLKADSLSAYKMGWTDKLDAAAIGFLEDTRIVTKEYLEEEAKKNVFTGFGEKQTAEYTYRGYLSAGLLDGHGIVCFKNGSRQESLWNKQLWGRYRVTVGDRSREAGGCGQKLNGASAEVCSDGYTCYSEYVDGVKKGIRYTRYSDGQTQCGSYDNEKQTGFYEIKYTDGAVYSGDVASDKREGYAILRYKDGSLYAGYFKEGKREGYGVLIVKGSVRYAGEWKNDHRKLL